MSSLAPGKCFWKFRENDWELSGTASQTTNCESLASACRLENKLKAISDPIRPRPTKAMLFDREMCLSAPCKHAGVKRILISPRPSKVQLQDMMERRETCHMIIYFPVVTAGPRSG